MRQVGATPESPTVVKKIQLSFSKPDLLHIYNDVTIYTHKDSYKLELMGSIITSFLEC
jgi:hypothetical protein